MYNNTDLDNWGKPKENAWRWFFKEYAVMLTFWLTIFILACCYAEATWWMLLIFAILSGAPIAMLVYVPKWYRELVDENYIQPFSKSKIKDMFKK
jgi:hypothetical protein